MLMNARILAICQEYAVLKLRALLAPALLMLSSTVAIAQTDAPARPNWQPTKPVEVWVTFGKGAHADIWSRQIAGLIEKLKLSPVPFKTVNIPKGIGVEAFPKLRDKAGDNHTIMLVLPNVYTVPLYKPQINFDLMQMTHIAGMGIEPLALWVKSSRSDINTLGQLRKAALAKGKDFKIVGPPLGTPRAMLAQMVITLYGLPATYVGIRKIGNTAKVLAERDFDVGIFNPTELNKLADPNANKPIVFFSDIRHGQNLHIPTFRETGMEITYRPGRMFIGPPGMSRAARDYYTYVMWRVFNSPDWQQIRKEKGHAGEFLNSPRLREFLAGRVEKHKRWKMAIEVLTAPKVR